MKRLIFRFIMVVVSIATIISCDKEDSFTCSLVETNVEEVTTTDATICAVINASNYGAIEKIALLVSLSGSENYAIHEAPISRNIELHITDLKPSTKYDYDILVIATGDSWVFEGDTFKTLPLNDNPEPEPDPEPEPEPTPEPEPEPSNGDVYRTGWYELPIEVDSDKDGRDDNDATLYYAHHVCAGHERNAQNSGSARNYTVCFSSEHHCPVWVAAPRHDMYEGSANRTNAYTQDPQIPADIQYRKKDADSGCNNGHMLGSAERTSSTETNKQVFYFSNIAPQYSSTFNTGGGAWNNLEDHIDDLVCSDTLYVVIGTYFDTYTDKYGNTARPAKISFGGRDDVSRPTMFYYALLRTKSGNTGKCVKDCSASELQCAAFVMCHEQDKGHKPQANDIISIDELEHLTGFTYFSNVPNAPKSTYNTNDWL